MGNTVGALVSVGADVVSSGAAHDGQKRPPSGTSLAHWGHRDMMGGDYLMVIAENQPLSARP